ncbi:hypothetical protein EWM64_g6615 [Hericium alpestre]|uniref:Uncharacterized protein n=1 Tax=Hericium alpestre TaxID=135208 RepID=A0A4Y9ZV59_9AGAM|nr:hypothetical protein EWM64_g6615 [Hericium alpestre]
MPRVFRILRISNSLKSAEGFKNLLQAGDVAGYVVEVVFHDVNSEAFGQIEEAAILSWRPHSEC